MPVDLNLTPAQYAQLTRLFSAALERDLAGAALTELVRREAGGDESLQKALLAMLEVHGQQESGAAPVLVETKLDGAVRVAIGHLGSELDAALPEFIGPYRIVRFLDAGGMGNVYEAEQAEPLRRVALKVIRLDALTESNVRRFEAEGHLLAKLAHPGIARIFAMGRADTPSGTVPYIVMEYIEGIPVTRYVRDKDLGVRERIAMIRRVCGAVQYAHDNGVLHRDIKPSNILVDANGVPKVVDFGIARSFGDDVSQEARTAAGLFSGTLDYASPEQALGVRLLDVRADVYGVGAVGYEVLSGHRPHDLRELPLHEAVRIVAQRTPTSLGSIRPALGGDLTAIFAKALATEPDRRYRSAHDLSEDLRRFLDQEPIEARPPSRLYQARKLIARNRVLFSILAGATAVLVLALVVALAQRRKALDAQAAAERSAESANRARYASEVETAFSALQTGSLTRAIDAMEAIGTTDTWESRYLRAHTEQALKIEALPTSADYRVVSPDGRWLVQRTNQDPPILTIVDLETGRSGSAEVTERLGHLQIGFHPRIPVAAVWDDGPSIQILDLATATPLRNVELKPGGVAPDPVRQSLVLRRAPAEREKWIVVDLDSGGVVARTTSYRAQLLNGRYLARWGGGSSAEIRDLATARVRRVPGVTKNVGQLQMDASGRWLVAWERVYTIHDLDGRRTAWRLQGPPGARATSARFSASGDRLALAYSDSTVIVVDPARRRVRMSMRDRRLATTKLYSDPICSLDPRTGQFVTITQDHMARWPRRLPPRRLRHAEPGAPYPYVYAVAWHPRGRWLASAAWDMRIVVWDTWNGSRVSVLRLDTDLDFRPRALAWSPNGRYLAMQAKSGVVRVYGAWDGRLVFRARTGALLHALGDDGGVSLTTATGIRRATLSEAATLLPTWTAPSLPEEGSPLPSWMFEARETGVRSSFTGHSRAGDRIATLTPDTTRFTVWDRATRSPPWRGISRVPVLATTLSPSADRLFVGLRDGTVSVYDVAGRRRLCTIGHQDDYVAALEFTPDGRVLAAGSGDGTVLLWDTRTPRALESEFRKSRAMEERVRSKVTARFRRYGDLPTVIRSLAADTVLNATERDAAFAMAATMAR